MKRRPFTSYTDAFYRVKGLADLAALGAQKLTEDNNRARIERGYEPRSPAELEAWKKRLRADHTKLNRLLRLHFKPGKKRT
jgi:hypothetical protein